MGDQLIDEVSIVRHAVLGQINLDLGARTLCCGCAVAHSDCDLRCSMKKPNLFAAIWGFWHTSGSGRQLAAGWAHQRAQSLPQRVVPGHGL